MSDSPIRFARYLGMIVPLMACAADERTDDAVEPQAVRITDEADLDLSTPLVDMSIEDQRRVCVLELESADLCLEAAIAREDNDDCEPAAEACREDFSLDAEAACAEPGFFLQGCTATAEDYLVCARARTEALSCADDEFFGPLAPERCDAFLSECPELETYWGFRSEAPDGGPGRGSVNWQPDDSIPLDQEIEADLTLEEPEQGFQMQTGGVMIPAGKDTEYFEVLAVPGEPDEEYFVARIEIEMTMGSHHVILNAVNPDSPVNDTLKPGSRGEGAGSQILSLNDQLDENLQSFVERVAGSQRAYTDERYPEGLGRVFRGGQKLIVDYHYFNPTSDPIPAVQRINFHTSESVGTVVRQFQWTHIGIDIPSGGRATTEGQCTFSNEVSVLSLSRHTHRLGTDFEVYYVGGEHDGELVYTSTDWEHDTDFSFDGEGLVRKPGEGFRFVCHYENPDERRVGFGELASDEMCILFGVYYRPDGEAVAPEDCTLL